MKVIETCPREMGIVLWGHCQNLLDDPRIRDASCTTLLYSNVKFKFLAMHKVQIHAGVISKLLYGFASVLAIIHSLKLADYLRKTYNNY